MEVKNEKPLGQKAYGSIPHLPGSRLGSGDHHITGGQLVIATEKVRDKHDLVIVQEKLDGSNCCVAKINGEIIALGRSGYLAETSKYIVHKAFNGYVNDNKKRFDLLLNEGERVCGEFLAQAVGTLYNLPHEPFVPFDIIKGKDRLCYAEFEKRVKAVDFAIPNLLNIGGSFSIEQALKAVEISGHGALEQVEGAIWRIERKGRVDFLTKFVRHDKEDGKYFPEKTGGETIWNCDVSKWILEVKN
jgi:ATP-dependent RNA circularization protein (DNA/RNA ligase family)